MKEPEMSGIRRIVDHRFGYWILVAESRGSIPGDNFFAILITLRCIIPVVCVTNEREESVVKQHN